MKRNVLDNELKYRLIEAKKERDRAFVDLDVAVLEARVAGATFREIAETTGMSVPWVQQVLCRIDPDQQHYAKRQHPRQKGT